MSLEQTFLPEGPKALDERVRKEHAELTLHRSCRMPEYPCTSFRAEHHRLFSLAEAHLQSPVAVCEQGPWLQ